MKQPTIRDGFLIRSTLLTSVRYLRAFSRDVPRDRNQFEWTPDINQAGVFEQEVVQTPTNMAEIARPIVLYRLSQVLDELTYRANPHEDIEAVPAHVQTVVVEDK